MQRSSCVRSARRLVRALGPKARTAVRACAAEVVLTRSSVVWIRSRIAPLFGRPFALLDKTRPGVPASA
eukprot:240341-Chlamydomonas_euryale.AAC.15